MAYIYDLTDTWNAGGTTFNAIKMNVTDSASASGSKLVTLQTNGTEHFSVTKAGVGYFSGNVGIGTSSPSALLHVKLATNVNARFINAYSSVALGATTDVGAETKLTFFGNPVAFVTNDTERMRIDSSGNVGIGTSSPGSKLHVAGGNVYITGSGAYTEPAAVAGVLAFDSTSGDLNISARSNGGNTFMRFFTSSGGTGTERMRIDSSGNVGIGTSSPANKLVVSDAGANGFEFDASSGILQTYNRGSSAYTDMRLYALQQRFFTGSSPTEKMRVTSAGDVGVGTTSPAFYGGRVVSNADGASIAMFAASNSDAGSASQIVFDIYRNGTRTGSITNTNAATAYNTSSDERLKHDIVNAPEASSLIDAIKVRSFKWNADSSEQRYGFVAQELLTVAPEAVSVPADPDAMMGVDYSKLVPMLVKEIQSLRARVAQLEGN